MNKNYIAGELKKRDIPFTFFWHTSGPALRFMYHPAENRTMYWNTLLPMDDESDPAFVDFVESNYKELHPPVTA